MKWRRVFLVVLLVGGFWFVTSHLPEGLGRLGSLGSFSDVSGSKSPLSLTEAHAAPNYDSEEQNNIAVYKKALPSVVNITSKSMTFNFFYGQVPQEGQGSGFILDKAGHVLTNFHVIADANRIEVMTSDKHHYKATIVGSVMPRTWRAAGWPSTVALRPHAVGAELGAQFDRSARAAGP